MPTTPLTPRWKLSRDLRIEEQDSFYNSQIRFNVCHAGRRSGKSEIAKMRAIRKAIRFFYDTGIPDGRIILGAPTHKQARDIFWRDAIAMVPRSLLERDPLEGPMTLRLAGGTEIVVMGLDVAARAEGRPIDHLVLDEYGNMKAEVWSQNLRPALSTPGRPPGTADFIGVPEGRNHYHSLVQAAAADTEGAWKVHHWYSERVVDPREIAAAKRDLDPLTYEQEYRGSFVSFQGSVYYQFSYGTNIQPGLASRYNPDEPLILCFDFNRKPGVAVIVQEMANTGNRNMTKDAFTAVIGEVHIRSDSNTMKVCNEIARVWGQHRGKVLLYGDATGGSLRAASISDGTDWDIVTRMLQPVFGPRLGSRVPRCNPSERGRVNTVNSRLKSFDGMVGLLLDPDKAPNLIRDLEGVRAVQDGSGAIDKLSDPMLTHASDALGYYIVAKFPIFGGATVASSSYM